MEKEIIEEITTDILEKQFKDLTDSEKAKIVLELNRFSLSDFWAESQKSLNAYALDLEGTIEKMAQERAKNEPQELVYSQFDRDLATHAYMLETVKSITDESIGAKIFRNKLEAGAKAYYKQAMERIEAGYDAPVYTLIDFVKNERALRLSVKVWLQQTINAYEKVVEAPEVQSAY